MRPEPIAASTAAALAGNQLPFHKMHGAGNDFVLLDWRGSSKELDASLAALLADRRRGIGCDQILILRTATEPACLAAYEIRNADGSPAGQCGNGARCIALYLCMNGAADSLIERQFNLQSPAGRILVTRHNDGEFELNMGEPRFAAAEVPIQAAAVDGSYLVDSPFGQLSFGAASMGNPHALLEVDNTETAEVSAIGSWLGKHPMFPEGCNIGFAQILNRGAIRLRVFERGAGETLACGSGACAAVAILNRAGKVDETVSVFLPGGVLVIQWATNGQGILMKGPATHVYSGSIPVGQIRAGT